MQAIKAKHLPWAEAFEAVRKQEAILAQHSQKYSLNKVTLLG
jgi:hypothetical protein